MKRSNFVRGPIALIVLLSFSLTALGAETASSLRRQVEKTEQEFYALYNKLNTERRYDIVCKSDRATGTNFAKRVCQPRYVEAAQQTSANDRVLAATHAGVAGEGPAAAAPESSWQDEGYRNNVLDVMSRSAKLKALGEKRDALAARLAELR